MIPDNQNVLAIYSSESVGKIRIKGTPYLKGWLLINVLKNVLNENLMRKSFGQQVGRFSVVELHLFSEHKGATTKEFVTHLHTASLNTKY